MKLSKRKFLNDDGLPDLVIKHESFGLSNQGFLLSEISTAQTEKTLQLKKSIKQLFADNQNDELKLLNVTILENTIRSSSNRIYSKITFSSPPLDNTRLGAVAIIKIMEDKIENELSKFG